MSVGRKRELAASRLRDVDLSGCEDSHSRLSAIASAILQPQYGWTASACDGLRRHLVYLLCGNEPEQRPTATRRIVSYGEYGRCNCSTCNWSIDPYDAYCRRCGALLTSTEYVHAQGRDEP